MGDEQKQKLPHLDLVSEVDSSQLPQATNQQPLSRPAKQVRILFGCCNVYASIHLPDRIRGKVGETWRVHCVRCGQLVEIPID